MGTHWDGKERRSDCCNDFESRVSKLEAFRETQERDIDRLLGALAVTNDKLDSATTEMTKIRTTQRNTHVLAGMIGTAFGGLIEIMSKKMGSQ